MKSKGSALALCAGPAHHRRAGAHGGKARGRHPAAGDRGAALAGLPDSPMARAQIRVVSATTSPRGRSACATAWISSSPARCARWTRPRSPRTSTSRTSCSCRTSAIRPPGKYSTSRGRTSRKASRWRCAPTSLMYTDRLPADRKGELISELTADEAAALVGKKAAGLTPAAARALDHLARAVEGGVTRGHLVTRRAPGRCCSSFSPTPASAP